MSYRSWIASSGLILAVSGCAAQQSFNYDEPTPLDIKNSMTINSPFEQTWDRMVKNLAQDFFVINNIEKASRIINVTFSADVPGEYVDCGNTKREYVSPNGREEHFNYEVANNSVYKTANNEGFPWVVRRTTNLEGRANIYVAPSGARTDISVNVRYVMKVRVAQQVMNKYEQPLGAPIVETIPVNFDTKKPSKTDSSGNRLACASKGVLERRILDSATP